MQGRVLRPQVVCGRGGRLGLGAILVRWYGLTRCRGHAIARRSPWYAAHGVVTSVALVARLITAGRASDVNESRGRAMARPTPILVRRFVCVKGGHGGTSASCFYGVTLTEVMLAGQLLAGHLIAGTVFLTQVCGRNGRRSGIYGGLNSSWLVNDFAVRRRPASRQSQAAHWEVR